MHTRSPAIFLPPSNIHVALSFCIELGPGSNPCGFLDKKKKKKLPLFHSRPPEHSWLSLHSHDGFAPSDLLARNN
jgi:hypothetical protein